MEARLQQLNIPKRCKIVKNDFSTYDPEIEFTEEKSLFYLQEDLLQIVFEDLDFIVDLGWYGDVLKNIGEFKIFIIKGSDWDNPIKIETSKSQKTITQNLEMILSEINEYKS